MQISKRQRQQIGFVVGIAITLFMLVHYALEKTRPFTSDWIEEAQLRGVISKALEEFEKKPTP